MAVEDITCGNENEARDSDARSTIPSRKKELLTENDLYTDWNGNDNAASDQNETRDSVSQCNIPCGKTETTNPCNDSINKNVMQYELPESMGCYQEKDYHVVKEICIDKGEIAIESENGNGLCTVLPYAENRNGDVAKEREHIELLSFNGSKTLSQNDYNEDDIQEWGAKEEEVDMELLLADALKSLLENHLVDDIGNNGGSTALVQTGEETYTTTDKIVDNLPRGKSLLESPNSDGSEIQLQSDQIPCSESELEGETPALISTPVDSDKSCSVNDLSYNSKVESATITFDFNSLQSTASNKDDDSAGVVPVKIDNEPARHEDGISDVSEVGVEIQLGQGESSFSMAGPLSGLIAYSRPMTYSGSISLRSDSSTTSTRSFAFPIIQSEWNSSPIRMAKADRRHYRKHRGWKQGLLCCRF